MFIKYLPCINIMLRSGGCTCAQSCLYVLYSLNHRILDLEALWGSYYFPMLHFMAGSPHQ